MGISVLHSPDFLEGKFSPQKYQNCPRKQSRSGRKKRSFPAVSAGKLNGDRYGRCRTVEKFPSCNLVMGQVKILKRGEELEKLSKLDEEKKAKIDEEKKVKVDDNEDSDLFLTDRLGSDSEMVRKQIRITDLKSFDGDYFGSAFVASPSPSSLPIPAFFAKKGAINKSGDKDLATKDLLRLLRLDLP
ncbi:uncharacterized protein LOC143878162 [Tasmannia lanceolata]|uniref:uncharacterized protein LOC143878162 n=1 Tax=Tasmannia lanceolata TaxID=3420 RepID=UPI0040642AD6